MNPLAPGADQPEADPASGPDDDLGLFGPGSVSWRVHREPILLVGGLRALFLQALHPRAIAGVTQNSSYRDDPWGRLDRTARYVAATIYGTTAEAEAAGRAVRRRHERLYATDPDTGARFRIDDPELLRWVHVTEVDSYAAAARRGGLSLTAADWDRYWHEQRHRARLVGLDPATAPGSVDEAAGYFDGVRPRLRMTRDAAETLLFLATPPPPWLAPIDRDPPRSARARLLGRLGGPPFRVAGLTVASMAFGLLPPWARRMYGTLGLPTTDLTASLSTRLLRTGLNALPHRWFEGPTYQSAMARADQRSTGTPAGAAP